MATNFDEFRKTFLYSAQKQPLAIIEDFNQFRAIAKVNKEKRGKILSYIAWSFLFLICLIFLSSIIINSSSAWVLIVLFSVSIIVIFFIIYLIFSIFQYPKLSFNKNRYSTFARIVKLVYRDMAEESLLLTKIDFNKSIEKNKLISTIEHPQKRRFKIATYQNPWLDIAGKFRDSTKFQLNLTEYNQKVYGYKRSRSGKSKYKSKTKFKGLDIKLKLLFSPRKYGAIQILQKDAIGAIKLPLGVPIKNIKITGKYIQLTVKLLVLNDEIIYQTVVMMFLSLYQILNLARKLSKSSK